MYGNPCRAPARIMELILLDQARKEQWAQQLAGMVDRVKKVKSSGYSRLQTSFNLQVRVKLRSMMEERCPHKDWTSITSQVMIKKI